MRRLLFGSILLLLKSLSCTAQIYGNEASHRVKYLKERGADSIIHFSAQVMGPHIYDRVDSIDCEFPEYSFWKQEGKAFAQKSRRCYTQNAENTEIFYSASVIIEADSIYHFIAAELDSIKFHDVEPMVYKRKAGGREYYEVGFITHPKIYHMAISVGADLFHKSVNEDNLLEYYPHTRYENLNYRYNISAAVWKLVNIIQRQVERLEKKNAFDVK